VSDQVFMRRALDLAAQRVGKTGDNPAVGCIIVKDRRIIGAGATGEGGRPHAEEVAIAQAGDNALGAIAYVTLEPCAQRSNGGVACADLLISAGIAWVVIATSDPHPNANGAGVERLRAAGRTVEIGMLEEEAREQNGAWFTEWS